MFIGALTLLTAPMFGPIAHADEYEMWRYLHDTMLIQEFSPYDQKTLETLSEFPQFLDGDSRVRSQALLQLGMTYHALGDYSSAEAALSECARTLPFRDQCLAALRSSSISAAAITQTPTEWDFTGDHGFVIPWESEGQTRLKQDKANSRLLWQSRLDAQQSASLVVGFDVDAAIPTGFTLRIETAAATVLQFSITDKTGHHWYSRNIPLGKNEIHIITLNFNDDFSQPLTTPNIAQDVHSLHRLTVSDVTAKTTTRRGNNDISILDFTTH